MVNCCVNPACHTEFKLLSCGDLYALERRFSAEFFWLCSACASRFDLYLDGMGCVSVRPRGDKGQGHPPQPDPNFRVVARAVRRVPWRHAIPAGERAIAANTVSIPFCRFLARPHRI